MKTILVWIVLIAAALLPGASAQEARQTPESPENKMQRLARAIVGTWSISVKDEPDAQNPKGESYSGTEVWSEPGGGPVMEQFHAKAASGDEYDSALIWWDTKAQAYRGVWCAPINDEGCNPFEASWEGDTFINIGEWEYHGKRRAWREVFAFPTPTTFTQMLYMGEPGAQPKLVSSIHGTKLMAGNN